MPGQARYDATARLASSYFAGLSLDNMSQKALRRCYLIGSPMFLIGEPIYLVRAPAFKVDTRVPNIGTRISDEGVPIPALTLAWLGIRRSCITSTRAYQNTRIRLRS